MKSRFQREHPKFEEPCAVAMALINAAIDAGRPPVYGIYIGRSCESKVIAYVTESPVPVQLNAAKAMADARDRRTDWVLLVAKAGGFDMPDATLGKLMPGSETINCGYKLTVCAIGHGWSGIVIPATESVDEHGKVSAVYPIDHCDYLVETLKRPLKPEFARSLPDQDLFRADIAETRKAFELIMALPECESVQEYAAHFGFTVGDLPPEMVEEFDEVMLARKQSSEEHRFVLQGGTPEGFVRHLMASIPEACGYSSDDKQEVVSAAWDQERERDEVNEKMLEEMEDELDFRAHCLSVCNTASYWFVASAKKKHVRPNAVALMSTTATVSGSTTETTMIALFALPDGEAARTVTLKLAEGAAKRGLASKVDYAERVECAIAVIETTSEGLRVRGACRDLGFHMEGAGPSSMESAQGKKGFLLSETLSRGTAEHLLLDATGGTELLQQAQFAYEGRWSQIVEYDRRHREAATKRLSRLMSEAAREAIAAGWTVPVAKPTADVGITS